ncbi:MULTISPECIES: dihydrolipoyl dehydrogenase [unclassified Cryobacterium]|uniref:dihydrolipoyl dehydrogenase n=1 Tax=unclassified Cryobacterium TaxID=2649013 RepID=UPI0010692538|nr:MULTISPECIES: dihydrolipoyl dehydrogenase [unclassified Cryobacterium]TFC00269.1 dihydrolipoyl dehydrogenase [Cryobacterium sp. MDB2-A-1]TFC10228.1 dihydrolipoyl dehydrogenase [Cryobacterium sp. MDB2-33-2]TFC13325.1 dihydrolipoyl dehydrogenase [Cryobacterium sp. MDB2-10]TFC14133.1 dihydrolipoyl dehydrogenase [Cryobacterium sp. MDB2-A-2]TFC32793.1 dihydrolipoyl dehydrogenase [Cryobacterium sp. MDB1-18-2]
MSEQNFDLVVLGGGSGGYAAALRAVQLGLTVGLIEKGKLGGTCLHVGCIPTKALLHSAEVADVSREAAKYGVKTQFEGIDMATVTAFREGIVASKYKGLQGLIKARGITVIQGEGRLVAPNTVQVGDDRIVGKNVVLATGSYSRSLPGLEIGGRVITSEQALELNFVPNKVAVLGGGVIGVEFASVWKSFGADVTIIEALPHLVPNEEESVSKQLERAFRKRGIEYSLGIRFQSVTQHENGVVVTLENGSTVEAEILLVAVGRGPVTAGLGFDEVGVAMDRGFVLTDERLATNIPGVYAVGDIVPGLQLAHRGFQQGIFVAEEIAGLNPIIVEDLNIPKVTYCDPEIASVGYSEAKASEKFGADQVSSYEYNLGGNGKSSILGTSGSIKVVRVNDGPIVGIHMIGARVGELIGEGQLVVNWEAYPEDIAPFLHAHPTQNEALGEAFLALAGKPLHAM